MAMVKNSERSLDRILFSFPNVKSCFVLPDQPPQLQRTRPNPLPRQLGILEFPRFSGPDLVSED